MALVAPVNLPYNIKTLWFDPNNLELSYDDKVVVKTARGLELGVMASDPIEVTEEQVKGLKSPLMPVVRLATENDLARSKELEQKSHEAMEVFKKLAHETSEDMHPVSVEYMLDGEKAVFYFESEERIDFRELVRKLASEFHVRIDMRQIGVRDEARIVGGIAHCGQEVCCKRLGGEFKPVSIRMAKEQDMSLNPQKISGLCGRLMCCLRYESDLYSEFKKTAPKVGAQISTPDGMAKVIEIDVPKESISVRIEDEKPVNVPVSMIEDLSEDRKSARISDKSWEKVMEDMKTDLFERGGMFDLPKFTTDDKLGTAKAVHHEKSRGSRSGSGRHDATNASEDKGKGKKSRGPKRRSLKISLGGEGESSSSEKSREGSSKESSRKAKGANSGKGDRKRRDSRHSGSKKGRSSSDGASQQSKEKGPASGEQQKLRPGHKSSGLKHGNDADKQGSQTKGDDAKKQGNRRRRRRSSHKGANNASTGSKQPDGTNGQNAKGQTGAQ